MSDQDELKRLRRIEAAALDVLEYAEDRVDADCVGDPPTFVGNGWVTVVNMLTEAGVCRDAAPISYGDPK